MKKSEKNIFVFGSKQFRYFYWNYTWRLLEKNKIESELENYKKLIISARQNIAPTLILKSLSVYNLIQ